MTIPGINIIFLIGRLLIAVMFLLAPGAQAIEHRTLLSKQSVLNEEELPYRQFSINGNIRSASNGIISERYRSYVAIMAFGVGLFSIDRCLNVVSLMPALRNNAANSFFSKIEPFGRRTIYYPTIAALVGHGLIFSNQKSILTGAELAAGLLLSQGVATSVKAAFGRERPYRTNWPFKFFEPGTSFISGHTISAFTLATILSKNYPRQNLSFISIHRDAPVVPILTYTLAGLVGVQRLYSNNHWATDVFFGALAGYAVGSIVSNYGNKIGSLLIIPGDTPRLAYLFYVD